MCNHLEGVSDVTAAARALTLACLQRTGVVIAPLNLVYDHVACEPLPTDLTALLDELTLDCARS